MKKVSWELSSLKVLKKGELKTEFDFINKISDLDFRVKKSSDSLITESGAWLKQLNKIINVNRCKKVCKRYDHYKVKLLNLANEYDSKIAKNLPIREKDKAKIARVILK